MGLISRWRDWCRSEPSIRIAINARGEFRPLRPAGHASPIDRDLLGSALRSNGKILQPVYIFETTISVVDPRVKAFDYLRSPRREEDT